MPVKIGPFEDFSIDEFNALRQQKASKTDPGMIDLLNEVEAGKVIRVPLGDEQSARGLRVAISRAATSRGLSVETVTGDRFVAVRKVDEPPTKKQAPGASEQGKRRGRPPKLQTDSGRALPSLADHASDLATGEA